MKEYIERDKAIDACFDGWNNNAHDCAENIRAIPAADVLPVVRGKWENVEPNFMAKCSNCRRYYISRGEKYEFHFCPNCGADMREANDEKA